MIVPKNNFVVLKWERVLKKDSLHVSNTPDTALSLSSRCLLNTMIWTVDHLFPRGTHSIIHLSPFILSLFSAEIPACLASNLPRFWHLRCQWPHLPHRKHPDEKKIPVHHLDLLFTQGQTSGWLNTFISVMLWSVSVQDTFIFQVHQGLAVTQVSSLSVGKKGLGWQKWLSVLQGALSSHDYKVLFEFCFYHCWFQG